MIPDTPRETSELDRQGIQPISTGESDELKEIVTLKHQRITELTERIQDEDGDEDSDGIRDGELTIECDAESAGDPSTSGDGRDGTDSTDERGSDESRANVDENSGSMSDEVTDTSDETIDTETAGIENESDGTDRGPGNATIDTGFAADDDSSPRSQCPPPDHRP